MSASRLFLIFSIALFLSVFVLGCDHNDSGDDDTGEDDDSLDDDNDTADDDDDGFEEVLIPAGPFLMGCNEQVDAECDQDEYPQHEVDISDFYIGVCEVTNQQFADYLNEFHPENVCDEATNLFSCIAPAEWDENGVRLEDGIWVVDSG
ncbi:MAG: SUMF1/EgtB/PvdO family nonheme iron enzyme, partial [Candidatus Alcyoniella australis]|nr:SUMF1/EgtB/PvdO family nonheme iron enzyme [Candidatus Alcyoniella australis]